MTTPRCIVCKDERWVCENHPLRAWGYGDGCCGGAGEPCGECNRQTAHPAMPPGTTVVWSINETTRDPGGASQPGKTGERA